MDPDVFSAARERKLASLAKTAGASASGEPNLRRQECEALLAKFPSFSDAIDYATAVRCAIRTALAKGGAEAAHGERRRQRQQLGPAGGGAP
jgi:hypothetical protein